MAIKIKLSNHDQVKEFYGLLNHPLKEVMMELHQIILETDPEIGEQIKWKSPAFYYTGTMAHFDPKEYKRDILVFNIHKKEVILLVFPTGARIIDDSGLLEGNFPDGRKIVQITSMADLIAKKEGLKSVIKKWLSTIEK
ncbi:MAG: DUF1801 domain-containing protein [Saprospiraceae bacterium]|nr:DUF1801 domain-containing protein [Saprospiraceae bacterium]